MANPEQNSEPVISRTEQKVLNQSQDKDFDVLAVELLGVDDVTTPTALNRIKVNSDGAISTSGASGGATEAKQDDIITEVSSISTVKTTAVTLTTANTAYKLPTSEQADRRTIVIYNVSDTDVYLGDSSVTTTNGILLKTGEQTSFDVISGLYAVCGTSSKILNVLEMK